MKYFQFVIAVFVFVILSGCGAYFNQPLKIDNARIGEEFKKEPSLLDSILPIKPIVVGVYKFRDQTGQYKLVENGSSWSTAVTQGGTSILLKSLEDSKWFSPIERENVSNLLNERQIIRSTRQEYAKNKKDQTTSIPPLLFAGVLLEGGVISYDSNIITGGSGARYFGAGGSVQYRQDRITVYLRAVSTSNGQILKTVYTSKTILSQGISANLFRYVSLKRLLEVETGVTRNEPTQLAVKQAIDVAVENLIIEGIIDGLWKPKGGDDVVNVLKKEYKKEKDASNNTGLLNRKYELRRGSSALTFSGSSNHIAGDYPNPVGKIGAGIGYKFFIKQPDLSISLSSHYFKLLNEGAFENELFSTDLNLEYNILPYDNFTPFLYGGVGSVFDSSFNSPLFKFQYGVGIEYLPVNNVGISLFGEQSLMLSDELDSKVNGKRDDYYWRIGLGVSFYFGKTYKKVDNIKFE